jgi:pimeloyl-ACP methyl ester carboxylesterase
MGTIAKFSIVLTAFILVCCAQVRGQDIELDSFIAGSGAPVVLLGGGTRGAAEFIPHAAALASEYRTIRLQSLNISRAQMNQPLPPDYSIRTETAAMLRTLGKLGVKGPADLVGHSLGALIALQFALEHPERVRTLTVAEPPAFWVVPTKELSRTTDMRAMYEFLLTLQPDVDPSDEQWIRFRCLLGECGLERPDPGSVGWQEWVSRRSALRGLSAIATLKGNVDALANFRRPVLIVTGTNTVSFHRRIDEILATHFPIVDRLELPGTHSAIVTAQDVFLNGLRSFLEKRR